MNKGALFFLAFLFIIFTTVKIYTKKSGQDVEFPSIKQPSGKPVVVVVVDSLRDETLQKAIHRDFAPAFSFLMNHGLYYPAITSSYPTMSVNIDSTLLTGAYADQHKIPGLVWFNDKEKKIINYGSSLGEIVQLGPRRYLNETLYNLNQNHLSGAVKTIHESASQIGEDTASINALIYRGMSGHKLKIPRYASLFNLMPKELKVNAPVIFSMGLLSQLSPNNRRNSYFWKRFGVNDSFSAEEFKMLADKGVLPAFTIVYLPDLDHFAHQKGPSAPEGIKKVEEHLHKMLSSMGGYEQAVEKAVWVILGDSPQSAVLEDKKSALIQLNKILSDYKISRIDKVEADDEVILGVNERMSYIYPLKSGISYEELSESLALDDRISFVAWKEGERHHVLAGTEKLLFKRGGPFHDPYQGSWDIEGNFDVLDITVETNQKLQYNQFPDALNRLYGALHSHEGRFLIADAKPGYEFIYGQSPTHVGGGSHGSLHSADSLSPLIIAGSDSAPKTDRLVDLKEYFLKLILENSNGD